VQFDPELQKGQRKKRSDGGENQRRLGKEMREQLDTKLCACRRRREGGSVEGETGFHRAGHAYNSRTHGHEDHRDAFF